MMWCFTLYSVLFVTVSMSGASSAKQIGIFKNTLINKSSRIVGGSFAERHQFPYQVSIRYSSLQGAYFTHICGGTLIHPQFVLTAAHCKQKSGVYEVAVGLLYRVDFSSDVEVRKVSKFIIHSQYPGGVSKYDIGLIELQEPVSITPAVNVAKIPTNKEECDAIEPRTLSGWGLTQNMVPIAPIQLRYAVLPRITNEQCKKNLIEINNSSEPFDDTMLCTVANPNDKQSACSGDSGGPLVDSATNTIVGVVSWGMIPCGEDEKTPSVYTNVCSYRDWIETTIEENSQKESVKTKT